MIDHDAYVAWKRSVFGSEYEIWHDGLNTGAVVRLAGDARASAIAMLDHGVSIGDAHASMALSDMGEVHAVDAMTKQLESAQGSARVAIARSIHKLRPSPSLERELFAVLRGSGSWSERIDAAIGLREWAGIEGESELLDAVVRDPEGLVRYHASESYLARRRVEPHDIAKHPEILRAIGAPMSGEPTAAHRADYARARAMLEALRPRRG